MEAQEIKVQRTKFDLEAFENVTVVKTGNFVPVTNTQEALSRLGNDSAKLLTVLNEGLRTQALRDLANGDAKWHNLTDEGEVNGEFTGTLADTGAVNALVLNLAKTCAGYNKDMTVDQKRAAKATAISIIKSSEAIKDGLKKTAVAEE